MVGTKAQVENFKRADRAKSEAIKQQRDTEDRSRRAVEEERRKRESMLDGKRQEIISRYESSLRLAIPFVSFWLYFVCVFGAILVACVVLEMKDGKAFMLSIIGSFIITPFIKSHLEDKAKESLEYKSILSKRDIELAVIDSEKAKLR